MPGRRNEIVVEARWEGVGTNASMRDMLDGLEASGMDFRRPLVMEPNYSLGYVTFRQNKPATTGGAGRWLTKGSTA